MAMPCEISVTAPPPRARFLSFASSERNGAPRGVWSLRAEEIVALDEGGGATATVLVPSEHVLMLPVELPLASHRRRLEALPFAIEDRLAEPLEALHVALGGALGGHRYLAGAVRHETMRRWVAALEAAGLGHAALVPDALALPVPPAGAWSVDFAAGRAVVRTDDGAGFAVSEAQLRTVWAAAGKPSCVVFGDPLPRDLPQEPAETVLEPLARRLLSPALDLRQGPYARRRAALSPLRRRVAIVAASGLLAHGAIAAAETVALRGIAAEREAETRSLLAIAAPGRPIGEDVVTAAADMLPAGSAAPGRFVPLLARALAAVAPTGVGLRSFSFDAREGTLALDVAAKDAADVRRAEGALAAAGLNPTSGRPTAEGGAVHTVVTAHEAGAGAGR